MTMHRHTQLKDEELEKSHETNLCEIKSEQIKRK
jgi:hypothetical protein